MVLNTQPIYEKVVEAPQLHRETIVSDRGVVDGEIQALRDDGFDLSKIRSNIDQIMPLQTISEKDQIATDRALVDNEIGKADLKASAVSSKNLLNAKQALHHIDPK